HRDQVMRKMQASPCPTSPNGGPAPTDTDKTGPYGPDCFAWTSFAPRQQRSYARPPPQGKVTCYLDRSSAASSTWSGAPSGCAFSMSWNDDVKYRPTGHIRARPQSSAMRFNDRPADRQS